MIIWISGTVWARWTSVLRSRWVKATNTSYFPVQESEFCLEARKHHQPRRRGTGTVGHTGGVGTRAHARSGMAQGMAWDPVQRPPVHPPALIEWPYGRRKARGGY